MANKTIAIDPGDIHVGVAYFNPYGPDWEDWEVETWEWSPTEICEGLICMCTRNQIEEIVIEEFVLYEQEYANQAWSPMLTSQLIGAIKLIAHMFRIPLTEQGASIKKPTRAQLRGRGIPQVGKSVHEEDAELHGYYRMLRRRIEEQRYESGVTS